MTRRARILIVIFVALALLSAGVMSTSWHPSKGTSRTTLIQLCDATGKPLPTMVSLPQRAGPDPWQTKLTSFAPAMQVQWVERDAPLTIIVFSPGYEEIGIHLSSGSPPQIRVGVHPAK